MPNVLFPVAHEDCLVLVGPHAFEVDAVPVEVSQTAADDDLVLLVEHDLHKQTVSTDSQIHRIWIDRSIGQFINRSIDSVIDRPIDFSIQQVKAYLQLDRRSHVTVEPKGDRATGSSRGFFFEDALEFVSIAIGVEDGVILDSDTAENLALDHLTQAFGTWPTPMKEGGGSPLFRRYSRSSL